jgi:predicted transcriptional regulator
MPYHKFREKFDLYKGDLSLISDFFQVSVAAATIRAENMKLKI